MGIKESSEKQSLLKRIMMRRAKRKGKRDGERSGKKEAENKAESGQKVMFEKKEKFASREVAAAQARTRSAENRRKKTEGKAARLREVAAKESLKQQKSNLKHN